MTGLCGDREELLKTSQPTLEEAELFPHNVSDTNMSDDVSSVKETELNVGTIGTEQEEEDPQEYCPGGYHPVTLGDMWDNRCCGLSAFHTLLCLAIENSLTYNGKHF